jgi:hypothetical protein
MDMTRFGHLAHNIEKEKIQLSLWLSLSSAYACSLKSLSCIIFISTANRAALCTHSTVISFKGTFHEIWEFLNGYT